MPKDIIGKLKRGIRKPPRIILFYIRREIRAEMERFFVPRRARKFTVKDLLSACSMKSFASLWQHLVAQPYPGFTDAEGFSNFDALCPGDREIILQKAEQALAHKIDLLGSGLIELGEDIDWTKDYKTGYSWPNRYFRDINYNNPERPSDVKVPWEISRLQWLMPAGQAYLLTGDERYADAVKDVLSHWILHNPVARSVNWSCTMEAALRIFTLTWFFHVFKHSKAWQDQSFREQLLICIYLHGDFTERYIEQAEINGNHFTADAAAMVIAGLFFNQGEAPSRWHKQGWELLNKEIKLQVFPDGVDYEASVPYHRLVLELFFFPALHRKLIGLSIDLDYHTYLVNMTEFAIAYSRADGTVPLWGDADDARTLPFGTQVVNDHRYLAAMVGVGLDEQKLTQWHRGAIGEHVWLYGPDVADKIQAQVQPELIPESTAFADGGFFVMQNEQDHIFIDCGPVGLADRGGHGHNDCLSFTAVLAGEELITDSGAYLYTASYEDRNLFRSTAYHNTPQVDGEEINRFIAWDYLWNLHYDAKPEVKHWHSDNQQAIFIGSHQGYEKLAEPVVPIRTITLEHAAHRLTIKDEFSGTGEHDFSIPLHLAAHVKIVEQQLDRIIVQSHEKQFSISWSEGELWQLTIQASRISPSYGVVMESQKLVWQCRGKTDVQLNVVIEPVVV